MAHQHHFIERALLKSRRLFLWDEIDQDSAKTIIQQIKFLFKNDSKKPIYIYIHSNGGCIDAHFAIIDEINNVTSNKGEIYTICQGKAYSAAAYILALGTPGCRFATPTSSIMMHSISLTMDTDKIQEHKGYTQYASKQEEIIQKMVAKACGKSSPAKFKKMCQEIKDTIWLSSKEAKGYGVIDDIWTPSLENSINDTIKIKKEDNE